MKRFRTALLSIGCIALSIIVAVEAVAQERQVPEGVSQVAGSTGTPETAIGSDQAKSAEGTAVAAANAEIRDRLRARPSSRQDAIVEAMALIETPAERQYLIVRYRLAWAVWSQSLRLSGEGGDVASKSARAVTALDLTPLDVKVIDKNEANRLLKGCDARLSAIVREPAAPFFNRPTNVRWDERAGAPVLRSFARVSEEENECVRADLNLVTGGLMCRRVACTVR